MKPKVLLPILAVLLLITGVVVFGAITRKSTPTSIVPPEQQEELGPLDPSVSVDWKEVKASTYNLEIHGLASKYQELEYEFTYDTEGLIQGGNNGKDPIEVSSKDEFEREIYLGTCSSGTCKPHKGIKKVSLLIILTDTSGGRSQFSKDYDL